MQDAVVTLPGMKKYIVSSLISILTDSLAVSVKMPSTRCISAEQASP